MRITCGDPLVGSNNQASFAALTPGIFIFTLAQAKRLDSLQNKKPFRYRRKGLIDLSR
ncbi:MAG TPA: hypothetical protein VIT44_03805 [Cyclobacteriaceae bacterium]